ncbi:MAG: winged helix-turn-helix domain-containing protein [Acidobacteria bacterium]|nr:winged helix-turn-helix domain-containing protein [Acidobacteriota bacterium]
MAEPRRVKEILAERASENFIGRRQELAQLLTCLDAAGPIVTWVHGIAGIGKSALLAEFRAWAATRGAAVVSLDCRLIEPTPAGLQRALGGLLSTAPGQRTVFLLDSYEALLLLDSWLRLTFVPELDGNIRIVIASRYPPNAAWLLALEWQGLFCAIHLRDLASHEAIDLLSRSGFTLPDARRILHFAGGHPLALRLAICSAVQSAGGYDPSLTSVLIHQLAALYLEGIPDPATRTALEAASVVRCLTRSLLQAMLPEVAADVYGRLAGSTFFEPVREGLILHEAVRDAVASVLRSSDPHRFLTYRLAAWRQLRSEAASANRDQMWAYTSGMIYLIQNPVVREAFFPAHHQAVSVEHATPADAVPILELIDTHETPASAAILRNWWSHAPAAFRAVRDESGLTTGFYLYLELRERGLPRMDADPLTRAWRRHLRDNPIPPQQTAVFLRRWLSATAGELPSPVQAACWLDVKRSYMELRPRLRRCYLSLCNLEVFGPTAQTLGFQIIKDASVTLDGVTHHLAVLDFGPGSVDAWLSTLAAAELRLDPDHVGSAVDGLPGLLDEDSRELVLGNHRVSLTVLEFALLQYLHERPGKAVSRAELLQHVWRSRASDSASNVVDVVVRSVRKKLGAHAPRLATIRGFGYTLRPGA